MKKLLLVSLLAMPCFAADEVTPCGTLASRLKVHDVVVGESIAAGSTTNNPRSFGEGSGLRPIVLGVQPDGGTKVAWMDNSGRTHVTSLDENYAVKGKDAVVGGTLRDFVAHNEGSAVLSVSGGMYLPRFDDKVGRVFSERLIGNPASEMHMGSLAYNGTHYHSYFGITGTSGYQAGHQGEALVVTDHRGACSVFRDWGCSHAIDARYLFSDGKEHALCLSDAYPSMGLFYNHGSYTHIPGDMSGGSNGRIGGMAAVDGKIALAYTDSEYAHLDILDAKTGARLLQWPMPLYNGATNLKVARYGRDKVLVSWRKGAKQEAYVFDVKGKGSLVESSDNIGAWAHPRGDFKTYPNGDIGWATTWTDSKTLRVMRLKYCAK
jgi:hypothetical protein